MARERLPVEPLREWLEQRLEALQGRANGRSPEELLASELEVNERTLYRWRFESRSAQVAVVEDALGAVGVRLADLYPEFEVETIGERFCPSCHEMVAVVADELCPWCEAETTDPPATAGKRHCPSCDRMVWPTTEGRCWRCQVEVGPIPWVGCGCGCGTMIHAFDSHGRRVKWVRGHAPRRLERDQAQLIGPFAEWLRAELRSLDPIEALAKRTGLSRTDVLFVLNERGETFSRQQMHRALWFAAAQGGGKGAQRDARVPTFDDLYPQDARARLCPDCGGSKARHAEVCKGCRIARDRVERRPRDGQERRISDELMQEAYALYLGPPERGYAEVAQLIFDRTPHASIASLANSLRYGFRANGWRTRARTRPRRFGGKVPA